MKQIKVKNGYSYLKFDEFTGNELIRIRHLKEIQEKFSKIKNIFLLVFILSLIVLFCLERIKNENILITSCFGLIISLVFIILILIRMKGYNYKNTTHNITLIIFSVVTFSSWGFFGKIPIGKLDNIFFDLLLPAILGYFLNLIISTYLYKCIFILVAKRINGINKKVEFKFSKRSLFKDARFYFSVTYLMADLFKNEIEKITKDVHKNDYSLKEGTFDSIGKDRVRIELILNSRFYKQYLILFYNWMNVVKTISFTLIVVGLIGYSGYLINIFMFFFIFHFLSRTIEIFFAFYKDIVRIDSKTFYNRSCTMSENKNVIYVKYEPVYINEWKHSAIRKPMRISLAIHSIVEVVISFSVIYYFAALVSTIYQIGLGLESNCDFSSYLNVFLYSTSVSFFNTSFPNKDLLSSMIHIWQVLISIVLISLSIATYIGKDDKLSDREAEYFFYIDKGVKHPNEKGS